MIKLSKNQIENVAPLFEGWDETMVWSGLQGLMGHVFADRVDSPRGAQILVGDFAFLSGDAGLPESLALAGNFPENHSHRPLLIIPRDDSWNPVIEKTYPDSFQKTTRYAIKKEPDVFVKDKLRELVRALPEGYQIVPIEEALYHRTREIPWAGDFCSQFHTYADYRDHGLGYVVLLSGEPVCGASSYAYYRGGIEIEIGTRADFRRRGLAAACASALILHCLDRGLYPSWDAANLSSVALAEKLGYHFDHEYTTYIVFQKEE